jgi:phage/plasmid-associated DNA primase
LPSNCFNISFGKFTFADFDASFVAFNLDPLKFSTTLITGKKTSTGTANPELSRAGGGVRWAVLEEPDGDEQINIGTLKALSGNDSYWARDLFEKGKDTREIQPLFKLIFICNKLPKMKYSDKATWNRIRVIPFESTFCRPEDPAPETYEEQLEQKRFPMDKEFSKKIPGMLQAFAWVLLEHRKKITVRIEPEKVRQATALYRKQNDIYRQYVEETISECSKSCLSLAELYPHFKDWFRDSLPHHTVPIKNEVKEYFAKLWGDPEPGCKWSGYRIRALADDIANGDAIVLEEEDLINYEEEGKNLPPI